MSQYRIRHDHDMMPTGAGDTVRQRLGTVVVTVGVLIAADVGEATWSAGVAPTTHRR